MKSAMLALSIAVVLSTAGTAHAELIIADASPAPASRSTTFGTATAAPVVARPAIDPAKVIPAASMQASASSALQGQVVSQNGTPRYDGVVDGWANNIPLELALRQVVPASMTINVSGVDLTRKVSWRGGKTWVDVIEDIARQNRFTARIDWAASQMTLAPAPVVAPAPLAGPKIIAAPAIVTTAPALTQPIIHRSGSSSAASIPRSTPAQTVVVATPPAATKPVVVAPVVRPAPIAVAPASISSAPAQWRLRPSMTLRENVEAWAKQAGWTVVWDAVDYPVAAEASFSGELTSPDGPLARLIRAYEGSDQPLIARLSTMDKVINVANKNYTPASVDLKTTPQQSAPSAFADK